MSLLAYPPNNIIDSRRSSNNNNKQQQNINSSSSFTKSPSPWLEKLTEAAVDKAFKLQLESRRLVDIVDTHSCGDSTGCSSSAAASSSSSKLFIRSFPLSSSIPPRARASHRHWFLPKHSKHRLLISSKIYTLLLQWKSDFSYEWRARVSAAVPVLEEALYQQATSKHDYTNLKSLDSNLKTILFHFEAGNGAFLVQGMTPLYPLKSRFSASSRNEASSFRDCYDPMDQDHSSQLSDSSDSSEILPDITLDEPFGWERITMPFTSAAVRPSIPSLQRTQLQAKPLNRTELPSRTAMVMHHGGYPRRKIVKRLISLLSNKRKEEHLLLRHEFTKANQSAERIAKLLSRAELKLAAGRSSHGDGGETSTAAAASQSHNKNVAMAMAMASSNSRNRAAVLTRGRSDSSRLLGAMNPLQMSKKSAESSDDNGGRGGRGCDDDEKLQDARCYSSESMAAAAEEQDDAIRIPSSSSSSSCLRRISEAQRPIATSAIISESEPAEEDLSSERISGKHDYEASCKRPESNSMEIETGSASSSDSDSVEFEEEATTRRDERGASTPPARRTRSAAHNTALATLMMSSEPTTTTTTKTAETEAAASLVAPEDGKKPSCLSSQVESPSSSSSGREQKCLLPQPVPEAQVTVWGSSSSSNQGANSLMKQKQQERTEQCVQVLGSCSTKQGTTSIVKQGVEGEATGGSRKAKEEEAGKESSSSSSSSSSSGGNGHPAAAAGGRGSGGGIRVPLSTFLAQRDEHSCVNVANTSYEPGPWDSWEEPSEQLDPLCCVCMVGLKGACFIPCGHTFCRKCSRELWKGRGTCPLCNRYIIELLDIY